MATVRVTQQFGVVVRRKALEQRSVGYRELLHALDAAGPLDADDELISFGPHFGGEAAEQFHRRLERLGLIYIDDFFVFSGDFPEWCGFAAYLRTAPDAE